MAICRCKKHSPPKGRKLNYIGFVEPIGFPDTALVCGLCDDPGLIWLTKEEELEFNRGLRIFKGPNSMFARMKTSDNEIKSIGSIEKL